VTETDPIDFFIYADQDKFYDALGPATRENVGGEAHADIRTMFALITPGEINDSWVSIVVPHELTHLVFDTATKNPYHEPPHWLNEGLAVYLSQGYDSSDRNLVENAAKDGSIMPLDGLVGAFPTTPRPVLPGLRRERLGGRLDRREQGRRSAGRADPVVCRRGERRRGVHERPGPGHGGVPAGLAGVGRGAGARPPRAAARAGRAVAGGLVRGRPRTRASSRARHRGP
jgi:hypothetical protein